MPIDPVCKMQINKEDAADTAEYQGSTYYFCSDSCKEDFERQPDKYIGRKKAAG